MRFVVLLAVFVGAVTCGPVDIRIESGNQNSFFIGAGPKQTFELVEEYRPLSRAYNPSKASKPVPISKAAPPPPVPGFDSRETLPATHHWAGTTHIVNIGGQDVVIHDRAAGSRAGRVIPPAGSSTSSHSTGTQLSFLPASTNNPPAPTTSKWMEWTKWSKCANNERVRVRTCLEVNGVKCEGPSVDTQKCFSFQHSDIPFAKDPMVIEKEILGIDPDAPAA